MIHEGLYMAEVVLETRTEVIQAVFTIRYGTYAVLGTFTMAGKKKLAGSAHGWQVIILMETKTDLFC